MSVPAPRTPVCTRHHIWMAGCQECHDQHVAEREAAAKRLERATR